MSVVSYSAQEHNDCCTTQQAKHIIAIQSDITPVAQVNDTISAINKVSETHIGVKHISQPMCNNEIISTQLLPSVFNAQSISKHSQPINAEASKSAAKDIVIDTHQSLRDLRILQSKVLKAINEYDKMTLTQQVTMNTDILNTYHQSLTTVQHTVENKITERMEKKIQHTHCNLAIANLKELLEGIQQENQNLTLTNSKLVAQNQHHKTVNLDSKREVKHWMQLIIETRMQNQLLADKIEQLQTRSSPSNKPCTPIYVHGVYPSKPSSRPSSRTGQSSDTCKNSIQRTAPKPSKHIGSDEMGGAEMILEPSDINHEITESSPQNGVGITNFEQLTPSCISIKPKSVYEERGMLFLEKHLGAPMSRCPSEGRPSSRRRPQSARPTRTADIG